MEEPVVTCELAGGEASRLVTSVVLSAGVWGSVLLDEPACSAQPCSEVTILEVEAISFLNSVVTDAGFPRSTGIAVGGIAASTAHNRCYAPN